jgi:serine/threonine protein kinase
VEVVQRLRDVFFAATRSLATMTAAEAIPATPGSNEIVPGDEPGGPSTSQTIMVSSLQRLAIHPDAARIEELDAKRRDGEFSEAEYAEWMELQDKGLVHRDIKPLNVMLTRTGAKLLDFNIASRVGDGVRTRSGTRPTRLRMLTSLDGTSPPTCSPSA